MVGAPLFFPLDGQTKGGVVVGTTHSLEDYPIMLEKIINKKTINTLSCVTKPNITDTKSLQVITRQGTKIGLDRNEPKTLKII